MTIIEIIAFVDALANLAITGDYTSALGACGLEEDHPLIDLILTMTGR